MVQVVTGVGLGLERSSASLLGANGALGTPAQGQGGDQVSVNAATGNLIDQRVDEVLTGVGLDDVSADTYNSLSTYTTNGWQTNAQRAVTGLTGTVNTVGSTITHVAADGSQVVYAWNAAQNAYVGNEDGGSYDTLTFNAGSNQWTFIDGKTQLTEVYDAANGGRLMSSTDTNGNVLTFVYTGSLLTSVTTTDTSGHQDTNTLTYNGSNQLSSIVTSYWDIPSGTQKTLTQVYYAYDGQGRLSNVTVDLSPQDNSIADANTYVTTYGYDGTSSRISSITQSDGSSLAITYNGAGQVASLTQTAASGVTRVTSFSYSVAGQTTITDPLSTQTTLVYNSSGELTKKIVDPTGLNQVTQFAYDAMGDVTAVTAPDGTSVTYTYDGEGNRLSQVDGAGNTTTWTYGSNNQTLSQTQFLIAQQGGSPAATPVTTYYVYDTHNNLSYTVSSLGDVTQYQYNGYGEQTSAIQYTADAYPTGGLPPAPAASASSQTVIAGTTGDLIALNLSGGAATGITVTSAPVHGTLSVSGPLVRYTPAAGYLGADSFTYTATNAGGGSTPTTVSLTVAASGAAPAAAASSQSVIASSINDPIALSLSGGAATSLTITSAPSHGSLSVSGASVTYTPTAGYIGSDSFTYTATNPNGTSAPATVSLAVAANGPPPIATASSQTVASGSTNDPIALSLSGGAATSVIITSAPAHGAVNVSGATVTYTPTAGYIGADSFSYTATNAGGTSSAATVSLTVAIASSGAPPAPIAAASSQTVAAGSTGTPIALKLSGGVATGFSIVGPSHGTLIFSGGTINYTPTAGYTGPDSFTYTASNAGGTASAATVSLTVAAFSLPAPIAVSSSLSVSIFSASAVPLDLSGGLASTITIITGPTQGTLTISGTSVTYNAGFGSGPDSFTYTATNASGTSAAATVSLTLGGTPPVPIAGASSVTVAAGSTSNPIPLNLSGGALSTGGFGGGGGTLTINSGPSHGTVSVSGASVTYTPTAGYAGPDSFTYTATNSSGSSAVATANIAVAALGAVPVTNAVSTAVAYGSTSNPVVLNIVGLPTSVAVAGGPSHGTVSVSGTSITYTPTAGYVGPDSFTYTASNASGTSTAATASITVNAPVVAPVANAVSTAVAYGSTSDPIVLNITGQATSVAVASGPAHGTVTVSGASISYTPTAGFAGADSFTYTATNAKGTSVPATASINVTAVNPPPVPIAAASSQTVAAGSTSDPIALNLSGGAAASVSITGSPTHGTASVSGTSVSYTPTVGYTGADSFTYTATNAGGVSSAATVSLTVATPSLPAPVATSSSLHVYNGAGNPIQLNLSGGLASTITIVSGPTHGTLSISGMTATYTPTAGYNGSDSFTYKASNATGTSSTATVSLTVAGSFTAPVAAASSLTVPAGSTGDAIALNLSGGVILGGAGLSITASASHGTVSVSGNSILYTPTAGYSGSDSFTYSAANFFGSSSATVSLIVAPAAVAPVANAISAAVAYGSINDPIVLNITGQATSVAVATAPAHGAVTISGTSITYTPTAGYSGSDSFTYTATNSSGTSSAATATITVNGSLAALPPVANAVTAVVANSSTNDPIVLNITGQATNVAVVTGPAHGTVTVTGASITYTPTAGYTGSDSFTYTATNAGGTSAAATASITVNAGPPAPIANAVSTAMAYGSTGNPVVLNITGLPTSVAVASGPAHGTVSVSGTSITYTPNAGYSGPDSFTYTATNANGTSAAATATIVVNALPTGSIPTLIQMSSWVASLTDLANTKRTDTTYDFRGNVATVTSYGSDTTSGAGSTAVASEVSQTTYVYDPAGRLIQTLPAAAASAYSYQGTQRLPTDPAGAVYSYDGLGRLLTTTDLSGATTSIQYNATSTTTVVTLANGGTETSTYDKAGELISYAVGGPGVATSTTTYKYDADGRLMSATDPTGLNTYFLYDTFGRKVADVAADGTIVEYRYNAGGQVDETIQYANKLTTTQLTALATAAATSPVSLSSVLPSASGADRYGWSVYDAAHRLIETIDGAGAATVYAYDGASELVSVTAYASLLPSASVTALQSSPPTTLILPTANAASDRVTRNFYDNDGHLIGALDGEGFLTQIVYDDAGQKIQTIAYATDAASSLWAGGTFAQLLTSVATSAADIHNWFVYDSRGLLRGAIDGDGDVTQYHYTPLGTVDQTITGQQISVASLLATPPTLATLTGLSTAGPGIDLTNFTYNLNGQVLSQVQALASGTDTTTYAYDSIGELTGETTDSGAADARTQAWTYDALGRVLTTTAGDGGVTHFAYDAAGRMVSKTDPVALKTLYYYDADGRLTYQVDPAGEVVQYSYDSFGERSDTIVYATAIAAATLAGLSGGTITGGLTTAVAALTGASDSHVDHNVTGTIADTVDALGATTTYSYDAFRDLVGQTDPLGIQTTGAHDRRGLMTRQTQDPSGLNLITSLGYDAFGRLVQSIDPNGNLRQTSYDQAGRTIQTVVDPGGAGHLNLTTTYSYDARGNVVSMTDAAGATTTYAYNNFERTITVTTPTGIVTSTTKNAWGQTVAVTNGLGVQTTYAYDLDGNLLTETTAVGTPAQAVTSLAYDLDDRLTSVTDPRGVVTAYTYDAASRRLTQRVDPTGLNLTTSYAYDAKGETLSVTDPNGIVTTIAHDLDGRQTQLVTDAGSGHLNLTTNYVYDLDGRTLTVTKAAGSAAQQVTGYTYDHANRLTQSVVDSGTGHLNLTTAYVYDMDGNAVAVTNAAGKVTRYVYDAAGRQVYAVDPLGDVSQTTYDADGRVIGVRSYATQVAAATLASWSTQITAAQVQAAVSTSSADETTTFVYDGDGRLSFTLDANLRLTEYDYDAANNLTQKIQYAGDVTAAASYSLAYIQGQITSLGLASLTGNRTSRYVYDAANREAFCIDPAGEVTAYAYDADGDKVKTDQYATAYTAAGIPTLAAMQSWATANAGSSDRISRAVYDNADRTAYTVDAAGYVTGYVYNGDGSVLTQTRFASVYSVSDGVTQASLAALIGAPTGSAMTTYGYDTAGRLIQVTDPLGIVTRMTLDAMGRVTDSTLAYGTSDAADTHTVYDVAGRISSQTAAYGQTEATTTSYSYDGLGRVLTATDGDANTVTYTYDALGHILTRTDPLGAVTTNKYNAFGNLVETTDPRGNSGFFYYDALNRLTLQVDPAGYATATSYTIGDQVASVTRYHLLTTGTPTVTTPPTINTSAADEVTTFSRDKDDLLIGETDASGATQTFVLDAFGDQITATNQLGGVTHSTYDARGLITSQTLPITSVTAAGTTAATSVTNTYTYDARGNRTQMVEAAGLAEQRTTHYTYDLDNRLIGQTGDAVVTLSQDLVTETTVTPTQSFVYDRRGNLIEQVDANGDKTFSYYDHANRKIAQVDAVGDLTTWTYDGNGNALTQTVYGDFLTSLPATPGGTPPSPVNPANYRQTAYGYDKDNRLTSTTIAGVLLGAYNGSTYQTATTNLVTHTVYDADGNAVQTIDANGASTYSYYDKLGRKIGQVDAGAYLTSYTLDQDGNVTQEHQYATALSAGFSTTTLPTGATNAADRITNFTYDRNGRRLTESRLNVASYTVSGAGALAAGGATATITYTYNALDEVTSKTEATGEATAYTYDSEGRQTSITAPGYTNGAGAAVQPQTLEYYDGLGDLTRTTLGTVGAAVGSDRVTTYTYGAGGRLATMTDATGFVQYYYYDAAGNVTAASHYRVTAAGASIPEATAYYYDALGRQVAQVNADNNGSSWVFGDVSQTRYDSYGEVTGKGLNGIYQQAFGFDNAGRMISSTAANGSVVLYIYDAAGNQTLSVASAGTNLAAYSIPAAITLLTNSGANTIGGAYVAGVELNITQYDARGEAILAIQPFQQISTTSAPTLSETDAYDAFGEVVAQTNALGAQTYYGFNTLGDLTATELPAVNYTDTAGNIHTGVAPVTYNFFDLGGRLVATEDANSNLTTRLLLAGTGYDGSTAQEVEEFQPDAGQLRYGYDVFGDQTVVVDQLGRVETRSFDGDGRILTDTHPTVAATGVALTDAYLYDGLGERIVHWSSALGASETTSYDDEGRVIQTTDFAGLATTNSYVWSGVLSTSGMGTFGGWTETTVNTSGLTETIQTDFFGRGVGTTDFGGHTHAYSYNAAGQLISQTSSVGQSLTYGYYNTGKAASIANGVVGATAYAYDAVGDKTAESDTYYNPTYGCLVSYENETASYDALGRVTAVADSGALAAQPMSVAYEYDLNGNIVHVLANYKTVPVAGGTSTTATQDYWYAYDSLNRTVLSEGQLVGGTRGYGITRGYQGTDILYDAAGERVAASTTSLTTGTVYVPVTTEDACGNFSTTYVPETGTFDDLHTEFYTYTADGYLSVVSVADTQVAEGTGGDQTATAASAYTAVTYTNDALGRLLQQTQYSAPGVVAYSRYNITYNADSQVQSDQNYQVLSSGSTVYQTNSYFYNASASGGAYDPTFGCLGMSDVADWTGLYEGGQLTGVAIAESVVNAAGTTTVQPSSYYVYNYAWGILSEETSIQYNPSDAGTIYTTALTHDANGYLISAAIGDGVPHTVSYVNNAAGQVMDRTDTAGPVTEYYYLNGHTIGTVSNTGPSQTSFATAISQGINGPAAAASAANFDENYTELDPTNVNATGASYTVLAGDTLQSIAQTLWGDANLWYLIADANGLNGSQPLAAGQSLIIPNDVTNIGHTSSTFKPYNATAATGFILPNAAPPPPAPHSSSHGSNACGIFGTIIIAIIAIAVQFIPGVNVAVDSVLEPIFSSVGVPLLTAAGTATAAGTVVGAIGAGVIGDALGQGVAIAVGAQDGFNFAEVAIAGITAGVTAGLAGPLAQADTAITKAVGGGLGQFSAGAFNGVVGNVVTQGIEVATGLQKQFNWVGVATAGIEGGVSAVVVGPAASAFGIKEGPNGQLPQTPQGALAGGLTGVAAAIAGSAARSLITGQDFGASLQQELPSVVGQTIGNLIGSQETQASADGKNPLDELVGGVGKGLNWLGHETHMAFDGLVNGVEQVGGAIVNGVEAAATDVGNFFNPPQASTPAPASENASSSGFNFNFSLDNSLTYNGQGGLFLQTANTNGIATEPFMGGMSSYDIMSGDNRSALVKWRMDDIASGGYSQINVAQNPNANGNAPWYEIPSLSPVNKYDSLIVADANIFNINPDLTRSVMYIENTHGYYGMAASAVGLNDSVLPMKLNSVWSTYEPGSFGTWSDWQNPAVNIYDASKMLSYITRAVGPGATIAQVATLYNDLSASRISNYGARAAAVAQAKPWSK